MTRLRARWIWLLLPCYWLVAAPAAALEPEFPQPEGFVNDYAHVIPTAQQEQLENYLQSFEQQSGIEIAVVTIDSLEGGDIDDSAVRIFEDWGIGKHDTDEGLLILTSIQDREARIEVGYGLEAVVPDAFAGRVLREVLFPAFRQGDYAGGLTAAVGVLTQRIAEAKGLEIENGSAATKVSFEESHASPLVWLFRLILLILAAILFIKNPLLFLLLFSGGRGGRVSGGFGGGGFGGFGGGLSGGGGASGRW